MPFTSAPSSLVRNLTLWALAIIGLHLCGLYSYNLFHSLAEVFAVLVAGGIFMVAWNTRHIAQTPYLLLLGVAFLFVGGLDLLHALAYKGMGVFPGRGSELATQLWIAARSLEAVSLLAAPLVVGRRLNPWGLLFLYGALTAILLLAIFTGHFPACYVEGSGLTPFKKAGEYVICLLLLGAGLAFWLRRRLVDQEVMRLMLWSVACTIAAELCFTLYISVYGLANEVGHILKVISFYLIYRATIAASLTRPYEVLFRDLQAREQNLIESEARVRALLASAASPIILLSPDMKVHQFNQGAEQVFGWKRKDILLQDFLETLVPPPEASGVMGALERTLGGEVVRDVESPMLARDGRRLTLHWNCAPLEDATGQALGIIISGQDISERKLAETERERLITELTAALAQIKTLSGLLPICASCKKVRDDSGYWRQIETYVEQHSLAEFSHGLCPDCAQRLYPGIFQDNPARSAACLDPKKSGN